MFGGGDGFLDDGYRVVGFGGGNVWQSGVYKFVTFQVRAVRAF